MTTEKELRAGERRRREILEAAKEVFLCKGFDATSMEDIIVRTSISRGGVYYHYKNKVDMMHDLMRQGMAYRIEKINEFLEDYAGTFDDRAVAEVIVDKILDDNELMSVYAIYLQAQKNNPEL